MYFKERRPHADLTPAETKRIQSLPLLKRLVALRGEDPEYVPSIKNLLPPFTLKDIGPAVLRIAKAIDTGERMCIVADYDADGATACAIGVRGLRMFGGTVDFVVPNRMTDGYGLSPGVVDRALEKKPSLIITVDNGISAIDGIRYAKDHGVDVVVTDHHLAGDTLPDALAIVNPNQPGCAFPSKNLAGCGVMFYVLVALRAYYQKQGDERAQVKIHTLTDILALGTIADVVKLDRNNRILVEMGLARIRAGQACPGLKALFRVAGKQEDQAGAMDLGFYIGPRINAAGRMDDATVGILCLTTDDPAKALQYAQSLHETNLLRREVQAEIEEQAEAIAATVDLVTGYTMVVADPLWHEGVIGIVAGRLKERYLRPTIVFTESGEGVFKGSGRSIPALHLRDALDRVDKRLPGVILKFGGHAMAAGLSIREDRYDAFKDAFESVVREMLTPQDLEEVVEHDGALRAEDLTVENARMLNLGVWGQGFPAPSFLTPAIVKGVRILKGKHTKFVLDIDGERVDGILFNQVVETEGDVLVHGRLDVNEWQGRESVQMLVSQVVSADVAEAAA